MIVNNINYAIKPFLIHVPGLRLSNEGNTAMRSSAEAYLRGSTDVSIMLCFFPKLPCIVALLNFQLLVVSCKFYHIKIMTVKFINVTSKSIRSWLPNLNLDTYDILVLFCII